MVGKSRTGHSLEFGVGGWEAVQITQAGDRLWGSRGKVSLEEVTANLNSRRQLVATTLERP